MTQMADRVQLAELKGFLFVLKDLREEWHESAIHNYFNID